MLSLLTGKLGMILLAVTVIAVALAVVSRNWSCRAPSPPHIEKIGPFTVVSVKTGASLTIQGRIRETENDRSFGEEVTCNACMGSGRVKTPEEWLKYQPNNPDDSFCWACGGHGKLIKEVTNRRESNVQIVGIQAPAEGTEHFDESRRTLEISAGCQIMLMMEGRLRNKEQIAVYGESGVCLQESQIKAGMASLDETWSVSHEMPAAWKQAQAEAQKAKRGIWATR